MKLIRILMQLLITLSSSSVQLLSLPQVFPEKAAVIKKGESIIGAIDVACDNFFAWIGLHPEELFEFVIRSNIYKDVISPEGTIQRYYKAFPRIVRTQKIFNLTDTELWVSIEGCTLKVSHGNVPVMSVDNHEVISNTVFPDVPHMWEIVIRFGQHSFETADCIVMVLMPTKIEVFIFLLSNLMS